MIGEVLDSLINNGSVTEYLNGIKAITPEQDDGDDTIREQLEAAAKNLALRLMMRGYLWSELHDIEKYVVQEAVFYLADYLERYIVIAKKVNAKKLLTM